MQKLALGINHQATEQAIKDYLKDSFLCVGTATYLEAVMPILKESQVDVLVIRDTLKGSSSIIKLVEEIRIESPNTRIVFISRRREKTDPLLAQLVSYGIYDIINKNQVPLNDIVHLILHPNTFRDVSMYYNVDAVTKAVPVEPEPEKKSSHGGGLFGLFGKPKASVQEAGSSEFQSLSGMRGPEINLDSLRATVREEERRKVQADMDELIKKAVSDATDRLDRENKQKDKTIAELKTDVRKKTEQAENDRQRASEAVIRAEAAEREMTAMRSSIVELKREHTEQIASLAKVEDPQWFKGQLMEKETNIQKLEQALADREKELQTMQKQLEEEQEKVAQVPVENHSGEESVRIESLEAALEKARAENEQLRQDLHRAKELSGDAVSELTEEKDFTPDFESNDVIGQPHTIVMMGAKHGVGNTTLALNTAVTLAKHGQRVLLMEINPKFPLINHFFEFTKVTNGIDTACDGILSGNTMAVDKAIIQPQRLKTDRRLLHAYKRLPKSLHFMVFSNGFLVGEEKSLDQRAMKDMLYYLTMQLKYAYVIIDLQPDDEAMRDLFLKSGFLADQLVMTLNQDSHSIASAGYLLNDLANGRAVNLAAGAILLINRYQEKASLKKSDIQSWLKISGKKLLVFSDDSQVYLDSVSFGIPYACSKARFVKEYEALSGMLAGG